MTTGDADFIEAVRLSAELFQPRMPAPLVHLPARPLVV